MINVTVSELIGPALDWAVAKAASIPMFEMGENGNWPGNYHVTEATRANPAVIRDLVNKLWLEDSLRSTPWSPSTDWIQGGPLISKYQIDTTFERPGLIYAQKCGDDGLPISVGLYGSTHLVAACRAIVGGAFGDTVDVPEELLAAA